MLGWFDLLAAGAWDDLRAERERLGRGEGDPLRFKEALASRLVERFHGAPAARAAAEHFHRVVRVKEAPKDLPEQRLEPGEGGRRGLLEVLEATGLVASRSEARRLVAQRAVAVDEGVVEDAGLQLGAGGYLLRVGKRRYARVRIG
jgi:tyrosyl-tRNA synthetase